MNPSAENSRPGRTVRSRSLAVLRAAGEARIAASDVSQEYDTLLCAARAFGVGLQLLRGSLDEIFALPDRTVDPTDFSSVVRELIRDGVAMTAEIDGRSRHVLALVQAELDEMNAQLSGLIGETSSGPGEDPYPLR